MAKNQFKDCTELTDIPCMVTRHECAFYKKLGIIYLHGCLITEKALLIHHSMLSTTKGIKPLDKDVIYNMHGRDG